LADGKFEAIILLKGFKEKDEIYDQIELENKMTGEKVGRLLRFSCHWILGWS
jgi:hypothetical protein